MLPRSTILVVEDDRNLMQGIRDILEIQGYDVLTAKDGLEALAVLQDYRYMPDLIVTYIMMPHMDGYQFFEAVRGESIWMKIPFIFLSAKSDKMDVRTGKMLGVDDYVTKPFDADDLLVAIANKLRRSRELEDLQGAQVYDLKRNILTILNHEFRTPMTYVVAYADMLNRDAEQLSYDEIKTFLRGVNTGAERLRRLIENFILLVELETGEGSHTFNWRQTHFTAYNELATRALTQMQSMAAEKQANLYLRPVHRDLPAVYADGEYLHAALLRLLDNAIKFTDQDSCTVTLSIYADQGCLCLDVSDQGRGIPEEEIPHIFDSFYQINREVYEDQGAGVGLTIVKYITEMHGGVVEVNSVVGQGSQFVMKLPTINN
jgi:two-component system sensor histidine kinase/response regulator